MLVPLQVAFGAYLVLHGQLTPGGGFQGGVVLAAGPVAILLAGRYLSMKRVAPQRLVESADAIGATRMAGGYPAVILQKPEKILRMPNEPEPNPPTGFPEPSGENSGDRSQERDPHHALNNPVGEPDPTEWPDPYDHRDDPRDPVDADADPLVDAPHPQTGAESTSEPNPKQGPEAQPWAEGPKRDKLDQ